MTEVVIDADTGNKRRLPIWMLRVNAGDEPRKSGKGDEISSLSEEKPATQATGSKMKPISRKRDRMLIQETDPTERTETSKTPEEKQRIRKASRRDDGPSNSVTSFREAKKKLKEGTAVGERKSAVPRKQNVRNNRLKNSDMKGLFLDRSDDEIEVTVEDLMSIAEEYVNADREKQHGRSATGESASETNPLSLSAPSKADIRGTLQATGSSQILSKCTTTRCSSQLTETEGKEKENPTIENLASNIRRTGDAAQDMLDLFLGPLLKKPSPEERDLGAIETARLISAYESNKQVRSRALQKEEALLVKKKSSLKDKVAMFLD